MHAPSAFARLLCSPVSGADPGGGLRVLEHPPKLPKYRIAIATPPKHMRIVTRVRAPRTLRPFVYHHCVHKLALIRTSETTTIDALFEQ